MITRITRRAAAAPARWWRRMRKDARHRAHRREAGMTGPLSGYDCYAWALTAFETSLKAESIVDAERDLFQLFLPLSDNEQLHVAVSMAALTRMKLMQSVTLDEIDDLRLYMAWNWEPSEVDS